LITNYQVTRRRYCTWYTCVSMDERLVSISIKLIVATCHWQDAVRAYYLEYNIQFLQIVILGRTNPRL
jgi:hypothetical protein